MFRTLNFTDEQLRKTTAWNNAAEIPGIDKNVTRRDAFGMFIDWAEYGNRDSAFGWEIDHAHPTALGGSDGFNNLRAMHWRNNATLGGLLSSGLRRASILGG